MIGRYDKNSFLAMIKAVAPEHLRTFLAKHEAQMLFIREHNEILFEILRRIHKSEKIEFITTLDKKLLLIRNSAILLPLIDHISANNLIDFLEGVSDEIENITDHSLIANILLKTMKAVLNYSSEQNMKALERLLVIFGDQLSTFSDFDVLYEFINKIDNKDARCMFLIATISAIHDGAQLAKILLLLDKAERLEFCDLQEKYWREHPLMQSEEPIALRRTVSSPALFKLDIAAKKGEALQTESPKPH